MCGRETLLYISGYPEIYLFVGDVMVARGMYYTTEDFSLMIQAAGGTWNDTKHRPLVCLIPSKENENMYWGIPMGKYNHRNQEQINRLNSYLSLPNNDIRSCYYHI